MSDTSEGVSGCEGIAVDGSDIYWADPFHGAIDRADLNGGNVDYDFVTGLVNPCGVAVDAGSVYWTDFQAGTVGRVGLEGGEPDRELIRGLWQPCGVAVGGQYIYWTGRNVEAPPPDYLARRPLAGGCRKSWPKAKASAGSRSTRRTSTGAGSARPSVGWASTVQIPNRRSSPGSTGPAGSPCTARRSTGPATTRSAEGS